MRQIRLAAALALAGLAGCGSAESRVKLVPVVGTVTQGGKPLADASLSFIPDQGNAANTPGTASSGPTGYYSASNTPEEFKNDPYMAQLQSAARKPVVAAKNSPIKSEFPAEVGDEGGTFDFDLGPLPGGSSAKK
jgi:hypothetical protein